MKKFENFKESNGWYFDVMVSDNKEDPSIIALSEDGCGLDDQLGSHNLPKKYHRFFK